jgi:hypothetical protein
MFGLFNNYSKYEKDVINGIKTHFLMDDYFINSMMNAGVFRRAPDYIREGLRAGFNSYECGAYLLLLMYMSAIEKGPQSAAAELIRKAAENEEDFVLNILYLCSDMVSRNIVDKEVIAHFFSIVDKCRNDQGLGSISNF